MGREPTGYPSPAEKPAPMMYSLSKPSAPGMVTPPRCMAVTRAGACDEEREELVAVKVLPASTRVRRRSTRGKNGSEPSEDLQAGCAAVSRWDDRHGLVVVHRVEDEEDRAGRGGRAAHAVEEPTLRLRIERRAAATSSNRAGRG